MAIGIGGGLVMVGLLLGAILGNIWVLLGFTAAGFSIAAAIEAAKHHKIRSAASCKLTPYPPYGY